MQTPSNCSYIAFSCCNAFHVYSATFLIIPMCTNFTLFKHWRFHILLLSDTYISCHILFGEYW
jgi:hypothetical protein